jgi:hypothetical protein
MAEAATLSKATAEPVRSPSALFQRHCPCGGHVVGGGECEHCRRRRQNGEGRRLEPEVARGFFGGGRLLADVRVHDGPRGAEIARRHGAVAVAEGADLFFAPNAYRPGTPTGLDLVAHELVHVAQQHRPDGPRPGHLSRAGDAWEREADRLARMRTLPPVPTGAVPRPAPQRRTAATQVATVLRRAAEGLGTDEDAIFNALAGRSPQEIEDIKRGYLALSEGETLEEMLRDQLSGDELAHALSLLQGRAPATEGTPTALAMRIRDAVEGPGTDEEAIYGALTGRSADQLMQIRVEYLRLYGESLTDRLKDELSGGELIEGLVLERGGLLEPEDEIKVAVEGAGTDEERLFAVLEEINRKGTIDQTSKRYAAKGYGDMYKDVFGDLSGDDLQRASDLVGILRPAAECSDDERDHALQWRSEAISLAENAIGKLAADTAVNRLSDDVTASLANRFNPGGKVGAVDVGLAKQVLARLRTARQDLLRVASFQCGAPPGGDCDPKPDCTAETLAVAFTGLAWGEVVQLCPALFQCRFSGRSETVSILHEFVHHTGVGDHFYVHEAGFQTLTPPLSLDNADSYALFAQDVE